MKSKERHKLHQNVLAEWIGNAIRWAKPYQSPIVLGSLLLLLGLTAYFAWVRMSATSTTQAWNEVNTALVTADVTKLPDVITTYPKTSAAYSAALVLGDSHLNKGCDAAFTDKTLANQELSKAIDNYNIALQGSRLSAVREQATFGLAQAHEARGELKEAEDLYKEITTRWKDGAFAQAAAHRLEYLGRPATKAFFDRFAQFNPRPAISSEAAGAAEKAGSGLGSLPAEPPVGPTSVKDLKLESGKGAQPGSATQPAKPANEEKPAAKIPTAEKPAAEKPAAEKPATKKPAAESQSPAKTGK